MKPWHRWTLFVASVFCILVGMFAVHEALWMTNRDAGECVFSGGLIIFCVGVALIAVVVQEDSDGSQD